MRDIELLSREDGKLPWDEHNKHLRLKNRHKRPARTEKFAVISDTESVIIGNGEFFGLNLHGMQVEAFVFCVLGYGRCITPIKAVPDPLRYGALAGDAADW